MTRIEVYSSPFCRYCWRARAILRKKEVVFELIRIPLILGWKPSVRNFREMVERTGGETTIPQIFVDGQHLGDEETMAALEREGRLDTALKIAAD